MRYLGNKAKLLLEIENFINENNIESKDFFDLFSGTGTVSAFFKDKYNVSSNDYMYFSSVIQRSILSSKNDISFKKLFKYEGIEPFSYFNNYDISNLKLKEEYFISNNYSDINSERKYFSKENGLLIDFIRTSISYWRKEEFISEEEYYYLIHCLLESVSSVANITGTFGAYLKEFDSRANKRMIFKQIEIPDGNKGIVYNEDSLNLIKKISGGILYIDPPYTNFDYSRGYHMLETIARYDYPQIKGITGVRVENQERSTFSKKSEAFNSFEEIIRKANFENIIISYSNHGLVKIDELVEMFQKYSSEKIVVKEISYREYKTINKPNKEPLKEYLILIKKDNNLVKSPLNYEGNKFKIIRNIINELPGKVNNFYDVFGGSATVTLNILGANKNYYNDINDKTTSIIKYLFSKGSNEIISEVNNVIKKNTLSKGNKDSFYEFRNSINQKEENALNLFTASFYSFQNILRFNSEGKLNITAGLSEFNENSLKNIKELEKRKKLIKNIKISNLSFDKFIDKFIDFSSPDDVFYFDPPYLITTASYNDGKRGFDGWDLEKEQLLLKLISEINTKGIKFILSNTIDHKGIENIELKNFINHHKFKVINLRDKNREEVIIKNF